MCGIFGWRGQVPEEIKKNHQLIQYRGKDDFQTISNHVIGNGLKIVFSSVLNELMILFYFFGNLAPPTKNAAHLIEWLVALVEVRKFDRSESMPRVGEKR